MFAACFLFSLALMVACTDDAGKKGNIGDEKTPMKPSENSSKTSQLKAFKGLQISDPTTSKNLQVFFIYSDKDSKDLEKDYLTLTEGTKSNKVIVTEQKNAQVQRLVISNKSKEPLFIAAGELVKGGKQDRTIQVCMVVPAGEEDVPLPSFCVEQSRWSSGKKFKATPSMAGNTNIQAIAQKKQGLVWTSVKKAKDGLRYNAKTLAKKAVGTSSTTSLNEELSDVDVKKLISAYKKDTTEALNKIKKPVVGFAYAVNGKMVAMHVFKSSKLFKKMWDKYVVSMAIDAGSTKIKKEYKPATKVSVNEFVKFLRKGKKHTEKFVPDNKSVRYLDKKHYTIEAFYKDSPIYIMLGSFDKEHIQLRKAQRANTLIGIDNSSFGRHQNQTINAPLTSSTGNNLPYSSPDIRANTPQNANQSEPKK